MNFTGINQLYLAVCAFSMSCVITFLITPLCVYCARIFGILDVPDGKIKSHKIAMPYLGGVAVYCGLLISSIFFVTYDYQVNVVLIGSALLLILGLVDDVTRIRPITKLLGQIAVALFFCWSGIVTKDFGPGGYFFYGICLLWVVTLTNAFNLIDVMDGLASVAALCAGIFLAISALMLNQNNVMLLLVCFAGALLGFLYYNKPPARIYLGDAGSLFLGGFLAVVASLIRWQSAPRYSFLAPIIILLIPLYEITALIVIRSYKGIPFYYASPDHFAIYLQRFGLKKYVILYIVAFISLIFGSLSLFLITA